MLRAVVLTQYWRLTDGRTDGQTDGQTDGIAVASTALAMRALRRAVKIYHIHRESKKGTTVTMATLSFVDGFAKLCHCCTEH